MKRLLIGATVAAALAIVVIFTFTAIFQAPEVGPGPVDDENLAAGTPEPGSERN